MDASGSGSGSSKRRKTHEGMVALDESIAAKELKRKNVNQATASARAAAERKHAAATAETQKEIQRELDSAKSKAREDHNRALAKAKEECERANSAFERAMARAQDEAMLKQQESQEKAQEELKDAQAAAEAECVQAAEDARAELEDARAQKETLKQDYIDQVREQYNTFVCNLECNEEMKRVLANMLSASEAANAPEATAPAPEASASAPEASASASAPEASASASAPEATASAPEASATAQPSATAKGKSKGSASAQESSATAEKASAIVEDLIEAVSQCGEQTNHPDMLMNIEKYGVLAEEMFQGFLSSFPKVPKDEDDEEMKNCYVTDVNGGLLLVAMVVCAMKKQEVKCVDFLYTIPKKHQFGEYHKFFRMQLDGYDDQEPPMKISFRTIIARVERLRGKKRTLRQQANDAKAEQDAQKNTEQESAGLDDFVEEYLKKIFDDQTVHLKHTSL